MAWPPDYGSPPTSEAMLLLPPMLDRCHGVATGTRYSIVPNAVLCFDAMFNTHKKTII